MLRATGETRTNHSEATVRPMNKLGGLEATSSVSRLILITNLTPESLEMELNKSGRGQAGNR